MPTPTKHTENDRPGIADWVIAFGALFFCIVIAPAIAEAVAGIFR